VSSPAGVLFPPASSPASRFERYPFPFEIRLFKRPCAAKSSSSIVNGGSCSSDSSQHDRGSRFPGRRCPCVEQFITVVCHIVVVTVDFQTTRICLRPRTDGAAEPLVSFFVYRTRRLFCVVRVLAVFGLNATLIFSLIIIIIK